MGGETGPVGSPDASQYCGRGARRECRSSPEEKPSKKPTSQPAGHKLIPAVPPTILATIATISSRRRAIPPLLWNQGPRHHPRRPR